MPNDILIVVIKELEFYVLVALNFITTNYKIKYEHSESVFNFMTPPCVFVCMCVSSVYMWKQVHKWHCECVEVRRGHVYGINSLLPPFHGFQGPVSGSWATSCIPWMKQEMCNSSELGWQLTDSWLTKCSLAMATVLTTWWSAQQWVPTWGLGLKSPSLVSFHLRS